jgi:predicted DNA-binding transcriptional regulator AlpA
MELIDRDEVLQRLQIRNTALYENIKRGIIPAPIKIGGASRWVKTEIEALIQRLCEERETAVRKPGPDAHVRGRGRPRKVPVAAAHQ